MSLHDASWRYLSSATHADGDEFRKRQRARIRAAETARKQAAAKEIAVVVEARAKVRTIGGAR